MFLAVIDGVALALFMTAVFVICWHTILGPNIDLRDIRQVASSAHGLPKTSSWERLQRERANQIRKDIASELGLPPTASLADIQAAQESNWPSFVYLDLG